MSYTVIPLEQGYFVAASFIIVWHPRVKRDPSCKELHKVSKRPSAEIAVTYTHIPCASLPFTGLFIDPCATIFLTTSTPDSFSFSLLTLSFPPVPLLATADLWSPLPQFFLAQFFIVSPEFFPSSSLSPIFLINTAQLQKYVNRNLHKRAGSVDRGGGGGCENMFASIFVPVIFTFVSLALSFAFSTY